MSGVVLTEDQLMGECHGWDGTTEFKLSNGEVSRQSAYRARWLYLYSPEIRALWFREEYWIELAGGGEMLLVQRTR